MKGKIAVLSLCVAVVFSGSAFGQSGGDDPVVASEDEVFYYSSEWEGERHADGRPRVEDDLLERLKNIKVEDVWQFLHEMGYRNQFEGGWRILHEDEPMVGRALTAQYMPARVDIQEKKSEEGLAAGHVGAMNSWPIDMLETGDIYVADAFGKIEQGTLIGDKLGNSIFARSENGVIFDGSFRDAETLADVEGFNAFARDWHPSFLEETMLMGINVPIRVGEVTVMPGDVILAKEMGVVFIPPHLVEEVVITAEIVQLRDEFVHVRVQEGVYTPGQVDARWTEEIEEDFMGWLEEGHIDRLPVSIEEMEEFLQHRTW